MRNNPVCKKCTYRLVEGEGKQVKLRCELGYTQFPHSIKAVVNALSNSGEVCRFIRNIYLRKETRSNDQTHSV